MEKKLTMRVPKELEDTLNKICATNNTSKSEYVRNIIVEHLNESKKEEGKIIKRLEKMEQNMNENFDKSNERIIKILTRILLYALANFHLLKLKIRNDLSENMTQETKDKTISVYVSEAKKLTNNHEVDSLQPKNNKTFFDNVIEK
ncbi:CopG-like DNA-binding [Sulfurimonas denitrificans DSM 1251]|uniref:CopG-like DNA-binding n=1 Tax=Sulfurimonas denitrificans (strain ATCC 33889 / DSM 1251) TaxID=326298 RepID=Q30SE4_SULDN|nr:CopG family transcriptional regulator [Sulfurimonas denitrificans]ABB44087.1 CopG-like DNA-binding [Sulfurimonas denitrificans DSM 1251]